MAIEIVRCPYCFRDAEVNTGHEVDVCISCYELIKVKDALQKRRVGNILSHEPRDGNRGLPGENMANAFYKYTKTMEETRFDEALGYAQRLLDDAQTPEERYDAETLITDTGARAVAALQDKHCMDILLAGKLYEDELQEIQGRMDAVNRGSDKMDLLGLNAGMMLQGPMRNKPEREMQLETEEILRRRSAAVDAAITHAMEDTLRYYAKLGRLTCTDSLLGRIADLGYGLQMGAKHRAIFSELFEQAYGKYRAKDLLFEETCREAWPELPAEVPDWRVERRREDGAILVTIRRTVSPMVESITYEVLPEDADHRPLFQRPVHFTQGTFKLEKTGRVESTNTVCTLPPLPDIAYFQLRIKTVTLRNGMDVAAREKIRVDPPETDEGTRAALKSLGGEGARSIPYREGSLWRCICGKYNATDRAECLCCGRKQDDAANLLEPVTIKAKAGEIRVQRQNTLLKPYGYKGLTCRCGGIYYTYLVKEGMYEASEPLRRCIGDDLPVCTALDERWFTYIDARRGAAVAIDLAAGTRRVLAEEGARDLAYENGLAWICGEELASCDLATGQSTAVYRGRATRPILHTGTGYFLADDGLRTMGVSAEKANLLAAAVHAYAVDDDTLFIAAEDRIVWAKIPTEGTRPPKLQVLARGVDTDMLTPDETHIYFYRVYLGQGSVQRLERKGGKIQTVHEGGILALYSDKGKAYMLTNTNETVCLTGTCHGQEPVSDRR